MIGDTSAVTPGGIRLGTPAMTTRGMKEEDMKRVAELIDRITKLAVEAQGKAGGKKLAEFIVAMEQPTMSERLNAIRQEVEEFAQSFPLPGIRPM